MGKGRGRKRKLAEANGSEETSQDTQESSEEIRPKARYVPRFGIPSKRAKLGMSLANERKIDESCTQPVFQAEGGLRESFTDEPVSATQPIIEQDSPQTVKEAHSDGSDSTQSPLSVVPGLSLTQARAALQTPTPPHTNTNSEVETSHTFPQVGEEGGLAKENMNLELLNPFNDDDASTLANIEPVADPVQTQGSQTSQLSNKDAESEPLLISQFNEDAILPDSPALLEIDNTVTTHTLYDDPRDALKVKLNLDVTSSLQETNSINCASEKDTVMEEMKGLRAEDLMESQLNMDMAVVPSVSPAKGGTQRAPQSHKRAGFSFNRLNSTSSHTEGQGVLRGLIQELSSINQYILRCKKELEAARKQRETWLRARQPQCHR